jgi:ABC-type sugar transport system permease subunit
MDIKVNTRIAFMGPSNYSTATGTTEVTIVRQEFFNYIAMNIIISVFSTMFNIFSAILIALLFKKKEHIQRNVLITTLF